MSSVHPLDFDDAPALARALEGVTTLYNTYWVRFPRGALDHQRAALNCRTLFFAARRAGVRRIVHISILRPGLTSPYSYFRGKALAERWLAESEVAHTVVRPAVLFGGDGVLLNNIAWLLRRFPVFAIGGDGGYRVRPIHVEDLAALCVAGSAAGDDSVVDAVGPEAPTFDELVRQLRDAVGSRSRVVHLPGGVLPPVAWALGQLVGDVVLTGDEFRAMAEGLADSDAPAAGSRRLSEWIRVNADDLGRGYANELDRHFRT